MATANSAKAGRQVGRQAGRQRKMPMKVRMVTSPADASTSSEEEVVFNKPSKTLSPTSTRLSLAMDVR
jgi:hypothetical protein